MKWALEVSGNLKDINALLSLLDGKPIKLEKCELITSSTNGHQSPSRKASRPARKVKLEVDDRVVALENNTHYDTKIGDLGTVRDVKSSGARTSLMIQWDSKPGLHRCAGSLVKKHK